MIRTQIQLTERQARQLRARARDAGVSLAEAIRRCVDAALSQEAPDRAARYERGSGVVGRFRDRHGARDVSSRHDRYLDDAYRE